MDIESFANAMLGSTGDDEQAAPGQMDALAEDVLRYDEYRADRDRDLGLEPLGRTSEEQFADGATYDPTRDETDAHGRRTVPLAALHSERAKRQELAAQTEAVRQHTARMAQEIQRMEQALAQQQQQQQQAPDFDADPKAYVEQRERQFAEQLGQVQQQQQIAAAQQFASQAEAEVVAEVGQAEYAGAVQAVMQYTANALRAAAAERGTHLSDAELQQALAVGLHQQVVGCAQQGLNPAAQILKRARQLGYRPQQRSTVPNGAELEQLWQQGAADNAPWPWR